jgi:hypothetical protein
LTCPKYQKSKKYWPDKNKQSKTCLVSKTEIEMHHALSTKVFDAILGNFLGSICIIENFQFFECDDFGQGMYRYKF